MSRRPPQSTHRIRPSSSASTSNSTSTSSSLTNRPSMAAAAAGTASPSTSTRMNPTTSALASTSIPNPSRPSVTASSTTATATSSISPSKARQMSHLNAQLAQLAAHAADLDNLLRMTAVQAESIAGLGGYAGGLFMAASKVLGEETVRSGDADTNADGDGYVSGSHAGEQQ